MNFVPFGAEAGDNVTAISDQEFISLGPLTLETPLVFYLKKEYQMHVRDNDVISEYSVETIQFLLYR